ncbi:hypothetical protein [Anditalea andensis]|uniref:Uncharacterized protein n=1 Tax=Anditalea andensis TaxID=1048983 RepID=A0A074KUJ6_9BACT|nr:hypothetical protein [Anditalea andensis]KEO72574.1 hypothetical protein EL17_17710 [Anditalea andensis]
MFRIDFLGSPGTGKSFIIDEVLKYQGDQKFVSRNRGLNLVAQLNAKRYSKIYKLAATFIKLFPDQDISNEIANRINAKRDTEFFNTYPLINDWLSDRMNESISSDRNTLNKYYYIAGLFRQIIDGLNLSLYPDDSLAVLMDESIAQHAPFVKKDRSIVKYVDADLIVHCFCDPSQLRENILKRERDNIRAVVPDERKTVAFLQKSMDHYASKAEYYEQLGINTLHMNTQDDVSININKIIKAISMLTSDTVSTEIV